MPDTDTMEKTRETTRSLSERKDLGEKDASFSAFFGNVAEAVGDSISHKLHPMIEQYAQLFAHAARTLVLRRPGDIGLDYEDLFFVTRRRSNRSMVHPGGLRDAADHDCLPSPRSPRYSLLAVASDR
jgi:hypothetical protein